MNYRAQSAWVTIGLILAAPAIFASRECTAGDCVNGWGRKEIREGSTFLYYEGEWVAGEQHGQGEMRFQNTSGGEVLEVHYSGAWKNGKFHGKGRLRDQEGNVYEGEFVGNQSHGQGTIVFKEPNKFVKNILDWLPASKRESSASLEYLGLPVKYSGEWSRNEVSGTGKLYFGDDLYYHGRWESNEMHGKGVSFSMDGYVSVGTWENGDREGVFSITEPDGTKDVVMFRNGVLESGYTIRSSKPHLTLQNLFSDWNTEDLGVLAVLGIYALSLKDAVAGVQSYSPAESSVTTTRVGEWSSWYEHSPLTGGRHREAFVFCSSGKGFQVEEHYSKTGDHYYKRDSGEVLLPKHYDQLSEFLSKECD